MEKQNLSIFNFSKFLLKIVLALVIFGYTISLNFEKLICTPGIMVKLSKLG